MAGRLYPVLCLCLLALATGTVMAMTGKPAAGESKGLTASPLVALSSGFLFQGHLSDGGSPANGPHDFTFKLFDAPTGGNQVGTTMTFSSKNVDNGLFTVSLDFGDSAFVGDARWLEMAVRVSGASVRSPRSAPPRPVCRQSRRVTPG